MERQVSGPHHCVKALPVEGIPWPKVIQRDVEFLEHAAEVNEWKAELAAAILCGMFGLGAWLFRAPPLSVMVGDGVNDAPSLAAAHIGVAMGARGSDAALEQADVVLMHDRLENFLAAFRLSQRARRTIRQNLTISLGTVLVLVSLGLAGQIPLTIGVVGHEGSIVVVVMNSLRLLFGAGGTNQAFR